MSFISCTYPSHTSFHQSMEKQCLILGPQNVGKTLLIKRLIEYNNDQQQKKNKDTSLTEELPPSTQPTTGTTLMTIDTPHGPILLKEYGGKMAPLWPKALPKADILLYVIDASNSCQLGVSVVLLMETLINEGMKDKPFLIFFNKTDLPPSSLSLHETMSITRINDLKMKYGDKLSVVSGSCLTTEGLAHIITWLHEMRLQLATV